MSDRELIRQKIKEILENKDKIAKIEEDIRKLEDQIRKLEDQMKCAYCGGILNETDYETLSLCKYCNLGICSCCVMYYGWRDSFNNQDVGNCPKC